MTKTWLITGASAGLGRIMTEKLLDRGDRVFATIRREGVLDDLHARHPDALRVLSLDVTDAHAVRRTIDRAFALAGRIDAVVSNAGYGLFGAATSFRANIDGPKPMPVYDRTPSGDIRRAVANGAFVLTGDAARTVDAMIAAGDAERPPLRLALTSTAYENISKALASRMAALEAQKAVALSADRNVAA